MLSRQKFLEVMADYIAENAIVSCKDAEYFAEQALYNFMNINGFRFGSKDYNWDESGAEAIAKDLLKHRRVGV
jgi:hypothetical protein